MSRVVDERVVEMSFDNSNFEKNVKVSMSTLEDLKKSLNLTDASKNLDKINASVSKMDFSSLSSSLETISNRFSALGIAGATVISELTKDLLGFAKKFNNFFIGGITSGGLTRAMNIENARFQIQGLNGDWDALKEDMEYGVNETAYGLDSAAKVASQLVASGMQAGDGMKTVLRGISGVAAMTNSTYDDIGQIFTTVSGNGKLMTQQLRQLASRGLNASATLAKSLGTTEAAVNEMVSKGEIDFMTFAKAMDDAFGEHAKEANSTFTGSLSNMKAALSRIGADFYSILIEQDGPLVTLFNAVKGRIDDFHNSISDSVKGIATGLGKAITTLGNEISGETAWQAIAKEIEDIGLNAEEVRDKLIALGVSKGIFAEGEVKASNFANSLKKGWVTADLLNEALGGLSSSTSEVSTEQDALNAKLDKFKQVVSDVWMGNYGNGESRVQALADAGYEYAEVQELVNKTIDDRTLSLEDLSDAELESIGYTQEEIKTIKDLGDQAKKSGKDIYEMIEELSKPTKLDYVKESFSNIFSFIKTIAKSIGDAFSEIFNFNEASNGLTKFLKGIRDLTKHLKLSNSTADKLKRTFKGLFAIVDTALYLISSVGQIALEGLNAILGKTDGIAGGFLDIAAAVGDALVKFRDWVKYTGPLAGIFNSLSTVGSALGRVISKLADVVGAYIDKLKESPKVQAAVSTATDVLNKALEKFNEWVEKGSEKLVDFLDKLKDLDKQDLQNLGSAIKNFVTNAISDFQNLNFSVDSIPTDLINGFVNGLKDKAHQLFTTASEIVKSLIEKVKEILGIHSPSTVFYDIGQNSMQGFINGVKDLAQQAISSITDVIYDILNNCRDVNFSDVVIAGTIGTLLASLKKAMKVVDEVGHLIHDTDKVVKNVAKIPEEIAASIKKMTSSVTQNLRILAIAGKKYINSKTWVNRAAALKNVAIAIGIIAASLVALSLVPTDELKKAGFALAGIATGLALVSWALSKVDLKNVKNVSGVLIALAVSLLLITRAIKKFGNMDQGVIEQGLAVVTWLIILMDTLVACAQISNGGDVKGLAAVMLSVAVSIKMMVKVIKKLGELDPNAASQGVGCVSVLLVMFGVLTRLVNKSKEMSAQDILSMGVLFISVSTAIKIIVSAIEQLGDMECWTIIKGTSVVILLMGFMAAFTEVAGKYGGDKANRAGSMLLKMAVAIGIMVLVIKAIDKLEGQTIVKGIGVIALIELLFVGIIKVSKYAGKYADKAGTMLLKMSIAIGILVGCIALIGLMDPETITKGIATISLLEILFGALIVVSHIAGENADKAGTMLKKMGTALLEISVAIAILSLLDPSDLERATSCIDSLMAVFAGVLYATKDAQTMNVSVMKIAQSIAILAAAVAALSLLDPGAVWNATVCLDSLMAMMALIIYASKDAKIATKSLYLITGVIGLLAGILTAMSYLDVQGSLANATALSILLLAMSASMKILDGIKDVSLGAIGAMALLGLVVAELAIVLARLSALNVETSLTTVLSLSVLLLALTGVTVILSKAKVDAGSAIEGVVTLSAVIAILTGLCAGIGKLNSLVGGAIATFVHDSIPILSDMGTALGQMVGNFLGAINDSVMESFTRNLTAIIDAINGIKVDASVGEGVKNLAQAVLYLTAADFVSGLDKLKKLFGGSTSEDWSTQFGALGTALSSFSKNAKGINAETFAAAASVIPYLTQLIDAIPETGGEWQKIFGETDLELFGSQLEEFAKSMKKVQNVFKNVEFNAAIFESLATAGQGLANLQSSLEPMGGKWQTVFGEADLSLFGSQLKKFAKSMKTASETLGADGINVEAFDQLKQAADKLVELKNAIGKNKGVITFFTGSTDFEKFGGQLEAFARSMVKFSTKCGEMNFDNMTKATTFMTKLKNFSKEAKDNGINIAPFTQATLSLGTSLQTFNTKITGINWESVSSATSNIKTLKNSILAVSGEEIDVSSFTQAVKDLAKIDMEALSTAFADTSTVTTQIQTFVTTLTTGLANGITTGGEQVKTAAQNMVSQVINTFSTSFTNGGNKVNTAIKTMLSGAISAAKSKYEGFYNAGKHLANGLSNGFKDNKSKIKTAAKDAAIAAKDAVRDRYQGFYNAGAHLVNGFAAGISANSFRAEAQARAMANKALAAAEKALDEHSPSREMYRVGAYFVQGFSNAIEDETYLAENAASDMAERALDTVAGIGVAVQKAMDMQDSMPLNFEPVLDSSNFGDYSWSGLLNGQLANLSLNEQTTSLIDMCNKIQNGIIESNEKVVNAINSLREDMGAYYENSDSEISLYLDSEKMTNAVTKNITKQIGHMNKLK